MSSRGFSIKWEDHQGLTNKIVRHVNGRCRAAKLVGIAHSDLLQEAYIVWQRCSERYDPKRGITFSAFYGAALYRELNNVVRRETESRPVGSCSISDFESADWLIENSDTDEPSSLRAEAESLLVDQLAQLSPDARVAFLLTNLPFKEVQEEFAALRAKGEFARSKGFAVRYPTDIDLNFVTNYLLRVGDWKANLIRKELSNVDIGE